MSAVDFVLLCVAVAVLWEQSGRQQSKAAEEYDAKRIALGKLRK